MSWRTRLALVGAAMLSGALLVVAWSAQQRAARAAEHVRAAERARLEAEGLLAAERASRARLEREARTLREQLARVRRAAPGARVREVTRWRTREIEVPCPPQELVPGGRGDGPVEAPPAVPSPRGSSIGSALRLRIEGVDARVETRADTRVALGEVEVWRVTPPPEQLVARLPWETTLHLVDDDLRPRARWAAGPAVGLVSGEWAYGAAVTGPPLRLGRLEARPLALALAGGGEWVVAGSILVQW